MRKEMGDQPCEEILHNTLEVSAHSLRHGVDDIMYRHWSVSIKHFLLQNTLKESTRDFAIDSVGYDDEGLARCRT